MFPEKEIIDALTQNPETPGSKKIFKKFRDSIEYKLNIHDYMKRNVLVHKPTNRILDFGLHSSYYSYYQRDYFDKQISEPRVGLIPAIHPSRWEQLEELSRDFNIRELPNKRYAYWDRNPGKVTIVVRGILNILKFLINNIEYCLQNDSSTSIVFLNSIFCHFKDDDINKEIWQSENPSFKDLYSLIDLLRLRRHLPQLASISDSHPYIKGLSQNVKYIKLNGDLHKLFTENIIVDAEMRRYLPPERLAEYNNEDTLYSLDDISNFISVGTEYLEKNSNGGIFGYSPDEGYQRTTILIDETFWWPPEHNSELNITLMRLFQLLLIYLKEMYSLYSSINELRKFVKRQPAEQRLAFAKNYNTRLQEKDELPFDVLDKISGYKLSDPNISKKIYSQNIDNFVRSKLEPKKTILDTYLDMLKDEKLSKEDRTKTKKKIYNRLNREGKAHIYNDLVSADIDPTMGDDFKSPTLSMESYSLDGGNRRNKSSRRKKSTRRKKSSRRKK